MELLEREAEIATLAAARSRCVLVTGPDGIGKTALLDEARRRAATRVLSARGTELERSIAFGGVQQLLAGVDGGASSAAFKRGGDPGPPPRPPGRAARPTSPRRSWGAPRRSRSRARSSSPCFASSPGP